jgi:hypothetical protein
MADTASRTFTLNTTRFSRAQVEQAVRNLSERYGVTCSIEGKGKGGLLKQPIEVALTGPQAGIDAVVEHFDNVHGGMPVGGSPGWMA